MGWLVPQTWTSGMILSGSTDTSSLNVQINSQLLVARAGWGAAIKLSLGGDQFVSNNVNQIVTWANLDWEIDPTNTLWASASGSKLLAPFGGRYELSGSLEWRSNASGYRASFWRMNGTTTYTIHTHQTELTGRTNNTPITAIMQLTTSDYVELLAFQNTGASLALHGGHVDYTRVTWRFLGGAS